MENKWPVTDEEISEYADNETYGSDHSRYGIISGSQWMRSIAQTEIDRINAENEKLKKQLEAAIEVLKSISVLNIDMSDFKLRLENSDKSSMIKTMLEDTVISRKALEQIEELNKKLKVWRAALKETQSKYLKTI